MKSHTYTKFSPEAADAVDLESLLEQLSDFLLQSGFAGGQQYHPFWGETGVEPVCPGAQAGRASKRVMNACPSCGARRGRENSKVGLLTR